MFFAKENDEVLRLGLQAESIKWSSRRIFKLRGILRVTTQNESKYYIYLYPFAELDILSTVRFFLFHLKLISHKFNSKEKDSHKLKLGEILL